MSSATVELKLSKSNRIYRPSETLEGKIVVKSPSSFSHYGVRLGINGSVNLQVLKLTVRGGTAGIIESFYGVVKPIPIVNKIIEVKPSGKIAAGTTVYLITADVMRGYLQKSLSATLEFIVETDKVYLLERPVSPEMAIFYITQDTQRHPLLPELKSGGFRVTGRMGTLCCLSEPISGELTVEASSVPICSIDVHLFRIESVLVGEKIVTETSLIQTTQIADGDVCRNMTLPVHVILPRLLTCPTVFAGPFSIEFKASIVINFESELSKLHKKSDPAVPRLWTAVETLPLELVRTK
ncbi:unnamed protein product [Linum tenue]|uniref:Uncharacterized protein n=1 Tax=Linum tenue TaxID=586396 RepID=A0AAV0IVQ0_9ROSI|nr:unnamed protein product [Linum tenue]